MIILTFLWIGCLSVTSKTKIVDFSKTETHFLRLTKLQNTKNSKKAIGVICLRNQNHLVPTDEKILCFFNKESTIHNGSVIITEKKIQRIKNKGNPGEFDAELFYSNLGVNHLVFIQNDFSIISNHEHSISAYFDKIQNSLSNQLSTLLNGNQLALAKALLLGETEDLSSEMKKDFSATGAIHVLAVSGMHIALFAEVLLFLFQFIAQWISRKRSLVIILVLLWIYALITGFSPSVIRSVFMFTIFHIGTFWSMPLKNNYVLIFSAWILLLIQPSIVNDIGFQLSYLAVFGIFNYFKIIQERFSFKNKILKFIWSASAISISAQLFTVPLTLYYFHSFPNYFIIANLGITVLSSLSMYLGFVTLLGSWIPYLNTFLAWGFSICLQWMYSMIHWIAKLPGSVAYGFNISWWQILCIVIGIFWLFHFKSKKVLYRITPILLVLGFLAFSRNEALNENHLFILNNPQPILVLKKKTTCHVFYNPKGLGIEKRNLLIDNYLLIYPADHVYYHPHTANSQTFSNDLHLKIKQKGSTVMINYFDNTLKLTQQNNSIWELKDLKYPTKIMINKALKFKE